MLKQVQKVEHVGCISRRLSMLLAFMVIKTFVNTAEISCCDRRTVAMWYCRFTCAAKSFHGIWQALSDKPRSGRPPKIDRKILNKARHWCEERAFTPVELHDYLVEILDRKDFEKSTTINGVEYIQKIRAVNAGDGSYNVINNIATVSGNVTTLTVIDYKISQTPTGIEVIVIDQPKITVTNGESQTVKVLYEGMSYVTNIGYVSGWHPAIIVAEAGGTIYNGYLGGSDSYSQTCGSNTTTWNMSFSADTSRTGSSSNDWRNVNWSISESWLYYSWCVFPQYTYATDVTVSGTDYSNPDTFYGGQAIGPYGWSANDIENPWDDINFKVEFKQRLLP